MAKKRYNVTMVVECEEGSQDYIAESVCDGLGEQDCVTFISVEEGNDNKDRDGFENVILHNK